MKMKIKQYLKDIGLLLLVFVLAYPLYSVNIDCGNYSSKAIYITGLIESLLIVSILILRSKKFGEKANVIRKYK